MSVPEMGARTATLARQWWWSNPQRRPDLLATLLPGPHRPRVKLTRSSCLRGHAAEAVVREAEALLGNAWQVFHLPVDGAAAEADWFRDPLTGRRAPDDQYCFDVPHRDEDTVGNIKFVWELSRHQPATLLACAWWLTGDDRYAERVAAHLSSWWRENVFLKGVHWVSGIEVGLRLLSWTWIRALLHDWPGAATLFEANELFLGQLYAHSRYLAAFRSTGSSANNHLIAELAGLAAASESFALFRESAGWAASARTGLAEAAAAQTHQDGWNREQASAYHLFVAEMLLAAVLAGRLAGRPMPAVEAVVRRMGDALAASLDGNGQPPRFGDGDDARGILVDAPGTDAVAALLDAARALFGAEPWWPEGSGSVLGHIAAGVAQPTLPRSGARPSLFPDCGIAILRADSVWVRCDAGPHGYGTLAAHGHADALSLELRCGGVEVLADPGTYCYHGEPEWRAYFRGTIGHNTLGLAGRDQARSGGPFLWLSHPRTTLEAWEPDRVWQASHDGYAPTIHRRRVTLSAPVLTVQDWLTGPQPTARRTAVRLAYHLGPRVSARLQGSVAKLNWPGGCARAALPDALQWRLHRGEQDPALGWYSGRFGCREPATVLLGQGVLSLDTALITSFALSV